MRTKNPVEQAIEALESISTIDEDPRYGHTSDTVLLLQCQSRATAAISALRQPSPSVDMEAMALKFLLDYYAKEVEKTGRPDPSGRIAEINAGITLGPCIAFAKYVLEARPSAGEEGEQWQASQPPSVSVDQLTEAEYKVLSDRMVEEHLKYGNHLREGHWAEIAARKVVSHMKDFREDRLSSLLNGQQKG